MKVACLQLSSNKNYRANVSIAIKLIKEAINKNCDLIITPEATTIISSNPLDYDKYTFSMKSDPFIKKIKIIAKKYKKWILIGSLFVKNRGKLRNRSVMINPSGNISSYYDKINMFDVNLNGKEIHQESKLFERGKKLKTVNLPWGTLGLTICYDLRFPEQFRNLSRKKVNFITVPSAFTRITGMRHWLILLRARAVENFCYIFAPNQYGKNTEKRETYGNSVIISPDGKVLKIKKKGIGIICCTINPEDSIRLRKVIPSMMSD
tara:strand:+ start:94 stop:885 length:792 start_codon:yes stop_codon:yes gene_type:complete